VSIAIEVVGNGEAFRQAIASVCFAGRVAMIGYAKGETSLDTQQIIKKELDVLGSRNALRVFPAVIKMLEWREKPFVNLITRIYPFCETPDAFRDWSRNPSVVSKFSLILKPDWEMKLYVSYFKSENGIIKKQSISIGSKEIVKPLKFDLSRKRNANGDQNYSNLNRFALNLLKKDDAKVGTS